MLILLLVSALVLVGLPVLYQKRSERLWYRDICARGIAATGEIIAVESLKGGIGYGYTITDTMRVVFRITVNDRDSPIEVAVLVKEGDLRRHAVVIGSSVAVRHLEHLPTEAVLSDMPCRPAIT